MPNALTHILGGALVGVLLATTIAGSVEEKIFCSFLAICGSLLPDIDHPQGTARKFYRVIGTAGGAIITFMLLLWLGLSLLTAIIGGILIGALLVMISEWFIPKHRGIIHSWKFAMLSGVIMFVLLSLLNIKEVFLFTTAFIAGYASHLVLDYFS